ncbi:MAG: hypothetical protein MJZ89_01820 [Paludibacteraceae bacterium]|nr:hypothetical protein [Paludibacteraceae bacterium]
MDRQSYYILLLLFCMMVRPLWAEEDFHDWPQTDGVEHEKMRIMSYNVENLFDARPDSLGQDSAFRIEGEYHWTARKYYQKLHHVAKVICAIGEWTPPAVIGLQEVENRDCIKGLCRQLGKRYPYAIVHYDSPDHRGIDVAMLYDSTRLDCRTSYPIRISEFATRDILYVCLQPRCSDPQNDTLSQNLPSTPELHFFVCHFPSQLGGAANTNSRRDKAFSILQYHVDSILRQDQSAHIIVMGDFNSEPDQRLTGLHNLMVALAKNTRTKALAQGTHKYNGLWSWLDQFYMSSAAQEKADTPCLFAPEWLLTTDDSYLGMKPFRTFRFTTYEGGYSDHLPIYIDIQLLH